MRPLTKKYIFKCKLAGEPIDLTSYAENKADDDEWNDLVVLLLKTGILSNRIKSSISIRARHKDDENWAQYPVIIKEKTGKANVWYPKIYETFD